MKKNIYFYWGNESMSYMRYMTLYSFCKFHPSWKVYLIVNKKPHERNLIGTVEKQDSTEYLGKDYSYLLKDLEITILDFQNEMLILDDNKIDKMSNVHIKDMLNWHILANFGGIVADMDILFTGSIDDVIDSEIDVGLICFSGHPQPNYIPVSFMYSSGNNKFFDNVYKNSIKNYRSEKYESCGTECIKEKNLSEIRKNYPAMNIQRLTDDIVFPFVSYPWSKGIDMLYNKDNSNLIGTTSKGIHWYGGAPLSQKYNNLINEKSIYTIDNTITKNIRRIL